MDVLAGRIVAGPHVRNACRRHLQDLMQGPERGLRFDLEAAEFAFGFFERILRLSEGQFEGRKFELHPMAGALIGVLLLPEKDAERVAADAGRRRGHRLLQTVARWLALGVAVVAYAIVAAWVIAVAASIFTSLAGAPQLPLAGLSGVMIRRLLPGYVRLVEKATGAIGGEKP